MQPDNKHEYDLIEAKQRHLDPLSEVPEAYVDSITSDINKIDDILASDETLTYREKTELYTMGINSRLDWLYSESGGKEMQFSEFEAAAKDTEGFMAMAEKHTAGREGFDPTDAWAVRIKALDLTAYRAQRYLKESQTTFKDTPKEPQLREFANSKMQTALRGATHLMRSMEARAHGDGRLAQDSRGVLYELMMTTYARYQTFDQENFDEVFVRTALDREDRPWNGHAYPKRSFDIVIEAGENTQFLQTKNYNNTDEYAHPIHKVQDTRFGRTLHDLKKYVADFNILVGNSGDPHVRDRVSRAGRELDDVFGIQLAEASVV